MTGEMYSIDQDGNDSNGDTWEVHAAIAKALNGQLHPFDVYQGPYISIGPDFAVGTAPYRMPVPSMGTRLWVFTEDGETACVYREDIDKSSEEFLLYAPFTNEAAIAAARGLFV